MFTIRHGLLPLDLENNGLPDHTGDFLAVFRRPANCPRG